MDILNESGDLVDGGPDREGKGTNRGNGLARSDGLAPFSTRLNAEKKAKLLDWARQRGVAAGVIIEELITDNLPERIGNIEKRLDLVLRLLQELTSHQPSSQFKLEGSTHMKPEDLSVPHDAPKDSPWEIPGLLAAWYTFKAAWDEEHPDPAFPQPRAPISSRRKGSRWTAWFGGS